jgi:type IV pilus assembly protein PilA
MNTAPDGETRSVPKTPRTPGLAVASLVLGILSILGASILIVPTVLAIVFGHVSYAKIQKDRGLTGAGIAMAGFILGYFSLIFSVFWIGLVAAMAIPAFQKVREESYHKMMRNDARQIAAAAQQYMLENGEKPVTFHVDPQTGTVNGPLSAYGLHIAKGTQEVDGTIEDIHGSFSLENPQFRHGEPVVFDAEGHEK